MGPKSRPGPTKQAEDRQHVTQQLIQALEELQGGVHKHSEKELADKAFKSLEYDFPASICYLLHIACCCMATSWFLYACLLPTCMHAPPAHAQIVTPDQLDALAACFRYVQCFLQSLYKLHFGFASILNSFLIVPSAGLACREKQAGLDTISTGSFLKT